MRGRRRQEEDMDKSPIPMVFVIVLTRGRGHRPASHPFLLLFLPPLHVFIPLSDLYDRYHEKEERMS